MLARDGQHSEVVTKAFGKVTPCPPSNDRTRGMTDIVSARWSSVTMRTMFGRGFDGSFPPPMARIPTTTPTERAAAAISPRATIAGRRVLSVSLGRAGEA